MTLDRPYFFRRILYLGAPVAAGQVGHIITGFADSIMVGQLGTIPLAAVSLVNAVFSLPFIFGLGLIGGITPLTGSAHAQDDFNRCRSLLRHSMLYAVIMSILLWCVNQLLALYLTDMGQEPEVVQAALPYYFWLNLSIIPVMLFGTLKNYMEGLGRTMPPMVVSLAGNLLNIVLNYLLIFGELGLPKLGLEGAGIATFIARVVMFVSILLYAVYFSRVKAFFQELFQINFQANIIKEVTKIGLPIGLQYLMEVGAFAGGAIMMGWLGATPQAAHQIAIQLAAFTFLIASGIGTGATIIVSNQHGKGDYKTLRLAAHTSFWMVLALMVVFAAMFALLHKVLPAMFIDDQEVIAIAGSLLLVAAIFQLFDGFQNVVISVLRGMSDVLIPTLFTFIAYWVIAIPGGYFFAFTCELGPMGIWLGYLTGLASASFLLFFRFEAATLKRIKS